jgi:uncharacterized membrane protein
MGAAPDLGDHDLSSTRMCSDGYRALLAIAPSLAIPAVAGIVVSFVRESSNQVILAVILSLIGWNVFVVVYVVLTARTFSGADSALFRTLMTTRSAVRSAGWRWLNQREGGPTYAIEATVIAFVVVLLLPHLHWISINGWVLIPLSLSILLSCWALSVVSYALYYAQSDLATPSLEFPGNRTGAYADYVYFSIAVSTTFGATDVSITTPAMRRKVNFHTILTFIYNSVIVALLASLLIG